MPLHLPGTAVVAVDVVDVADAVDVVDNLDCHMAALQVDHSCGAVDLPDVPCRDDAACSGDSRVRPCRMDPGEVLRLRRVVLDLAAVDMLGKVRVAAGVGSPVYPRDTGRLLLRIAQDNHAEKQVMIIMFSIYIFLLFYFAHSFFLLYLTCNKQLLCM